METFLTTIYVIVCIFLVLVVLLQSGKGGGIGAALGGGGQTVFGGAGAGNFLTRLTSVAAALFMILSISLAYLSSSSENALERAGETAAAKKQAIGTGKGKKKATKAEKTAGPVSAAPDSSDSDKTTEQGDAEGPGSNAPEANSDASPTP